MIKDLPALTGIDLNVRAGEIVGLAGVAGNGQSELAEVITGMRKCTAVRIVVQSTGYYQSIGFRQYQERRFSHP